MIQIIAYRDFYSNKDQCWDVTQKVMAHTKYNSVCELIANLDSILLDIPFEERYNLHYTIASCTNAPRQFDTQTLIPLDIDDIGENESIDEYAAIVSEYLSIPFNEFIQVSSGHGIHFLIETDHTLKDQDELKEFQAPYKRLCEGLQKNFKAAGLIGKIDPKIYRPAGTLRLPGTINRCLKKAAIQYPDTNCTLVSSTYAIQSFASILGERAVVESGEALDSTSLRAFPSPDTEYLLEECRFVKWVFDSPQEVSEPEWYAALSIVGHLDNGNHLAHQMSKGHPSYTHRETESKLTQAMASSGPRTCQNIDTLSDKCRTCPHFGKVTSPILLKGPDYIQTKGQGFWIIGPDAKGNLKPLRPAFEDLRRYFEKLYSYIATTSGQVWIYEEPIWKEFKLAFLEEFAQEHFNPKPNSSQVSEFVNLILRTNVVTDSWFTDKSKGKVNMSNGVLDILTLEFMPHDKKFGFKHVLKHDYNPNATCPRFDKFMKEVTLNRLELEKVLLEYSAYAISGMDYIYHKALMLTGEGSNGKSVFLNILKKLVGPDAYSSVLMNQLEQEYARSSMVDKLFNVAEETPSKRTDSSWFKILSSGGNYQAREPYGKPIHVESNRTKLIMACNDLPEISDFSNGFIRRLLIVPFDATFSGPAADPKLEKKLSEELPGIFNRIIEAYKRLVDQEGFSHSEIVNKTISHYRDDQSSTLAFIESKLDLNGSVDQFVSSEKIRLVYINWCKDVGIRPLGIQNFSKDLKRFTRKESKVKTINGRSVRIYEGIVLRDFTEASNSF